MKAVDRGDYSSSYVLMLFESLLKLEIWSLKKRLPVFRCTPQHVTSYRPTGLFLKEDNDDISAILLG